jgi:nucleoside 2-deoxyribosyltransferase
MSTTRKPSTRSARHASALLAAVLLGPLLLGARPATAAETIRLYLAGPGVFLEDAVAYGAMRKARIAELARARGWPAPVEGLYPLDNTIEDFAPDRDTGLRIYRANMTQIRKADAVIANMVRFRSPSMDVGTAFEMGVGRGMGKAVFGYYDAAPFYGAPDYGEGSAAFALPTYAERVSAFYGLRDERPSKDPDGLTVEHFAMTDNLMLLGALDDSGAVIAGSFDEAVTSAVEHVLRERAQKR